MQIKKLEYYDNKYKWKLKEVNFLPNLNLLVGVSGVGKTMILRAIFNLKSIANGNSLNGVKWNICFIDEKKNEYTWSGEFETRKSNIYVHASSEENDQVKLINEKLICENNNILIERKYSAIIFNGSKTPKLSPFKSVVELFKEEDQINPIQESLNKITIAYYANVSNIWNIPVSVVKKLENPSLSTLQASNLPIRIKLSIIYSMFPEKFQTIKQSFISVFPNVSDIKIETIKDDDFPITSSQVLYNHTIVFIKEKGIENWIENISSGMWKTLMYISELYLSPDNSVILIDEFENSLGFNCLDSVTEIVSSNQNIQFIITSHHPYIINNISPAFWKIVTRKAGLVTVKNPEDFHISKSRHKAFIDLINVLEDEASLEY